MSRAAVLLALAIAITGCATTSGTQSRAVDLTLPPYTPNGSEPKVAVLDFANDSFFESEVLGRGVASMFESALVRSGRFVVVDRENLTEVVREQKLDMAGITAKDYTSIGQILGVDYLISGTVTEFGIKRTGTSVGGGAVTAASLSGGGAQVKKERGTARIVVDTKITSVSTSAIAFTSTAVGEAFSENVNAGLAILTGGVGAGAQVGSGVVGFDETIAGKASRAAAYELVREIASGANLAVPE